MAAGDSAPHYLTSGGNHAMSNHIRVQNAGVGMSEARVQSNGNDVQPSFMYIREGDVSPSMVRIRGTSPEH
jgi:hypothetical protein